MKSRHVLLPAFAAAALLAACADSAPAPRASTLHYADPAPGGWRLVRDPSSTPSRLVLALVGPEELKTRGAGFNLKAPPSVRFRAFESTGFPVEDTGVYALLNKEPEEVDPQEPRLLAGGVKAGNVLTVGVFQKDRRHDAQPSGVPLLRIALELDPGALPRPGTPLPLEVLKTKYSPEDIGAFAVSPNAELVAKGKGVPFSLAVGELVAR